LVIFKKYSPTAEWVITGDYQVLCEDSKWNITGQKWQ